MTTPTRFFFAAFAFAAFTPTTQQVPQRTQLGQETTSSGTQTNGSTLK